MTRKTVLIAGVSAFLVLALWYLLLWSPRKADLSEARDRKEKAEALRDELAAKVSRLRASEKDQPMKNAQVEALRTTIPDEPNLAAFILDTNDAAGKAGIDFISVAPTEPALPSGNPAVTSTAAQTGAPAPRLGSQPAEIGLQLAITGGYFQVLDFLNRVNDMPRLVVTDGLNIAAGDNNKLTVALNARMFVRAVPPGYGDAPLVATPAPTTATAATSGSTPAPSTTPPTATAAPSANASTPGARS